MADLLRILANTCLEEQASAMHGMACGSTAAGVQLSVAQWQDELEVWFNDDGLAANLGEKMVELADSARRAQTDPELTMRLLLPGDDDDLDLKKAQLSAWCRGFLHGFAADREFDHRDLSADVNELLADFMQIAQLSNDADEADDEADLVQIEEYVRIGSLLIFMECALGTDRK